MSFGSLLVKRDQWDAYWGPKKIIFLIRDIDDAAMAAAPVKSCQFVVLRSPRGRLGWYNTCAIAYAAYASASRVRYISHFEQGLLEGRVFSGDAFAVVLDNLRRVLEESGLGVRLGRATGPQVYCGVVLTLLAMICQSFGSKGLWRAPSTAACGVSDYPTSDLSRRESASRSTSEKSK
jgi:hypothetical protein